MGSYGLLSGKWGSALFAFNPTQIPYNISSDNYDMETHYQIKTYLPPKTLILATNNVKATYLERIMVGYGYLLSEAGAV